MEARSIPAADPAGYALAYDEAKRALDEQERVVAELRSRAGTLIAAAAITTSFLGGRILGSHHLHPLAWAAIGCFAFVGITLLALLWPWRDWRFTVNAQSFIQTYLEPSDANPSSFLQSIATSPCTWRPHGQQTVVSSAGYRPPFVLPRWCS